MNYSKNILIYFKALRQVCKYKKNNLDFEILVLRFGFKKFN